MAEENHEEFGAALDGDEALSRFLEPFAGELAAVTSDTVAEMLGGLVTDVDRAALTGEFAEYQAASLRTAVSSGTWGWHDDDLAFTRPWGFVLDEITVPVSVWQGRQDAMVPYAHGEWLAAHIAGARPRLFEDEGHLSSSHALGTCWTTCSRRASTTPRRRRRRDDCRSDRQQAPRRQQPASRTSRFLRGAPRRVSIRVSRVAEGRS